MIRLLEQSQGNIIATLATYKLTEDDYQKIIPVLEGKLNEHGKIRWYFEMEDFEGWTFKAIWEDLNFDVKHANDFEKIAMVGDKNWEKWMTTLMKPFTTAEVKYFDLSEKDVALEWIAK